MGVIYNFRNLLAERNSQLTHNNIAKKQENFTSPKVNITRIKDLRKVKVVKNTIQKYAHKNISSVRCSMVCSVLIEKIVLWRKCYPHNSHDRFSIFYTSITRYFRVFNNYLSLYWSRLPRQYTRSTIHIAEYHGKKIGLLDLICNKWCIITIIMLKKFLHYDTTKMLRLTNSKQ